MDLRQGIIDTANSLGMPAHDLATIISFESGFNPNVWGGAGGRHYGLIQFGPSEREQFGVRVGDPSSQLGPNGAIAKYFRARGWKPGMGLMNAYSIVNAGSPGLFNASDTAAGGTPGTVADKVRGQMGQHAERATALLGGSYTPSEYAMNYAGGGGGGGGEEDAGPLLYNFPRRSSLADTMSASVGPRLRRSSGGDTDAGLVRGALPESQPPAFEFASATPETPPPAFSPPALAAVGGQPEEGLADIFQIKEIGRAGMVIDPQTGQPAKPRRTYG